MFSLLLHNSLTQRKEVFTPLHQENVRLYVCGPTVYDRAHLGNARSAVVFDQLYRVLLKLYPQVTYVRNITDVDDKINAAAQAKGISIHALTEQTTQWYHQDMQHLNTLPPTFEPRATEHIAEIISLITTLLEKKHAYVAEHHVLFDIKSFAEYGALSHRSQDEILAGARVEIAPYKHHPADFVLWKPSEGDIPGWDSPWGYGRPGWHIECSAMGLKHLGFPMDLHAGGHDLMFPHHENEIAQGTCATGQPCARYWVHNGMLTVEGEKMSKSLGNFVTVEQALNHHNGETIRYAFLSGHYRQALDWNSSLLEQAQQNLDRFYNVLKLAEDKAIKPQPASQDTVLQCLLDDLNTPKALAAMHSLATQFNRAPDPEILGEFVSGGELLGIFSYTPADWFQGATSLLEKEDIERLITERQEAKNQRDFTRADAIRQELAQKGIALEDHKEGKTTWRHLG